MITLTSGWMYFVTATTHTIGTAGYRTNFEARREQK